MQQNDFEEDPSEEFVKRFRRRQKRRRRLCIVILVLAAVALALMTTFWR